MLKKVVGALGFSLPEPEAVNPARFDDPVAETTEWIPLIPGAANFGTHRLTMTRPGRAEFKATASDKVFSALLILIGIGLLMVAALWVTAADAIDAGIPPTFPEVLLPLLSGLVFAGIGTWLYRGLTLPIVFDTRAGHFWKGRNGPDQMVHRSSWEGVIPLEDIHALQIISKHIRSDKRSYHSYELNLILRRDGTRVNLIDHGKLTTVREDAETLSRLIGVPLWDATR